MQIIPTLCKSILTPSTLSGFTLNCYRGCSHRCIYCYARYTNKFKNLPAQEWESRIEIKTNAPEILSWQLSRLQRKKEQKRKVFMSSVCDAWQPIEAKYRLSRRCLEILLQNDFDVEILTKSNLILKDLDLITQYKNKIYLGITITCLDMTLAKILEPYAPEPLLRLDILKEAEKRNIQSYIFLGPLIPKLTAETKNIEQIFLQIKTLKRLNRVYIDRLNLRWGVLNGIREGLIRNAREDIYYRLLPYLTNPAYYSRYSLLLRQNVSYLARKHNLSAKVTFCF